MFKSIFLIISLCLVSPKQAFANSNGDEVIIVLNNWTSQIILSKILAKIYQDNGIKSSFRELKTSEQWGELARGWSHIQVEVWQGTMEEMLNRLVKSKKAEVVGTHQAITREDWWYPKYVEKLCPGLPDWKALKECSNLFVTETSNSKGRYLGGPWEKPDKARVRALGLDFEIERAKDGDALWVELEKAYKIKKPIILFNWTPNWVESKYKGQFVNFPDFDPRCETDSSWGINKQWKYDCGNPKKGWLKKLAWKGLKKKNHCAYKILKNFNLTNEMIAKAAALVDYNKLSHEIAVQKWLETYQVVWKKWVPKDCQAK